MGMESFNIMALADEVYIIRKINIDISMELVIYIIKISNWN